MIQFSHIIKSSVGLHALPAAHLVKILSKYPDKVDLTCNDTTVDAKKLLRVVSLGAVYGTLIIFRITGENELMIFDELKDWLKYENL